VGPSGSELAHERLHSRPAECISEEILTDDPGRFVQPGGCDFLAKCVFGEDVDRANEGSTRTGTKAVEKIWRGFVRTCSTTAIIATASKPRSASRLKSSTTCVDEAVSVISNPSIPPSGGT
jgi:hypothetical protein